jgi:hypothetical protein
MKVVVPKAIAPANYPITPATNGYSNATDFPEWNIATTYALGDKVIVDALKSTFQSLTAGNIGNTPGLVATAYWVRIGASNAWKPFDAIVSSQSTGYTAASQLLDLMVYRLIGIGRFTTVCVLSTDCASVRVQFSDPDGTNYDKTINSVDTSLVIDAWTYFFAELSLIRNFIFDAIDGHGSEPVLVTVSNGGTGEAVLVGEIVIGEAYELGVCHAGARLSLVDFSRKEANDFGDLTLVERAYSFNGAFDIEIPVSRRTRVQTLLATLRATLCVWFPSETDANGGIVIYGFPRDFAITYDTPERAYATLEIEGLT